MLYHCPGIEMCLSTPEIYNINNIKVDLATVPTNSEVFLPWFMIMWQRCMQVFKFGSPLDPFLKSNVVYCRLDKLLTSDLIIA